MCSTLEGPHGRGAPRRGSLSVRARRRSLLWSRSVSAGCAAPAPSMMLKRTKAQRQRIRISCPDSDSQANMHCISLAWHPRGFNYMKSPRAMNECETNLDFFERIIENPKSRVCSPGAVTQNLCVLQKRHFPSEKIGLLPSRKSTK
jgi:hypothetical protein